MWPPKPPRQRSFSDTQPTTIFLRGLSESEMAPGPEMKRNTASASEHPKGPEWVKPSLPTSEWRLISRKDQRRIVLPSHAGHKDSPAPNRSRQKSWRGKTRGLVNLTVWRSTSQTYKPKIVRNIYKSGKQSLFTSEVGSASSFKGSTWPTLYLPSRRLAWWGVVGGKQERPLRAMVWCT